VWPAKTRIRRLRLGRKWVDAMTGAGLSANRPGGTRVPQLRNLACRSYVDTLTVRMLAGQLPEDFAKVSLRLAHAFGARHVNVTAGTRMDEVILSLLHGDPLAKVVRPFPITASPQFTALPLALRENGDTWALRLFGNQILVIGATDAGKGSVAWSFIRSLAGGIASGLVQVWAFDPKGGMELAAGAPMFTRFLCDKYDEMADALDEAVTLMRERTYRLRGKTRQHTPSLTEPLIVILIDELAALTAYGPDKQQKERIKNALALILTQGRAVGVHILALAQDARKEAVPNRDLFTVRIGLRMNEASQVDLVLDDQAINRGALCHRIPTSTPGVAYVLDETQPTAERIRFSYPTDADITAMARTYARAGVIDGHILDGDPS
jgi:S-DNA-T family DNA segregation ATPase FtsK/SpoIIIE